MRRASGAPALLSARARPARVVLACALLLLAANAHAAHNNTGICPSLDIRNSYDQLRQLQGCRVIEGSLSIVLLERRLDKENITFSFPELREVTGYVLIYRIKLVNNLGEWFPNLTVIRGRELFKDFALVLFDNTNIEALGLKSLMVVERGGVRFERNDRLCYVNNIDWSRITAENAEVIIRGNYDTRFCGFCPNSRGDDTRLSAQCPADSFGNPLCWDSKNCQKVCPTKCGKSGCMSDNATCCNATCLGGCTGPKPEDCHVCRNFSLIDDAGKRVCVSSCPEGMYELYSRCVTMQECRRMPPPPMSGAMSDSPFATKLNVYKIYRNKCVFICPSGYKEEGTLYSARCVPCSASGCFRECEARTKIDSVTAAEQYRGCTHIKGKLEISIRAGGGNTLDALEKSLGEIREIAGCLQVTRSYPLVSLMFFKNLKRIVGDKTKMEYKGQVLHVLNNPNLELLWDWGAHGPIEITGGTIYIHLNPKLCYNQLLPLKKMTSNPRSNFTDIEVSEDSNGNQASCLPDDLDLKVTQLKQTLVILKWRTYCPNDGRQLLGYSLYYKATETNVTFYDQRDACSDVWNVLDIAAGDFGQPSNSTEASNSSQAASSTENKKMAVLQRVCDEQPSFSPLPQLIPYTRYAAYVKTYTTSQDKRGAQSSIIYFRTLPGRPSPPQNLLVDLQSPHSVHVRWQPPAMPNGTITQYLVEVQANNYNREQILARYSSKDTCSSPPALDKLKPFRAPLPIEKEEEKLTGDVKNGSCVCKEAPSKVTPITTRFNPQAEEERTNSITFENELQNWVYRKSDRNERVNKTRLSNKIKRSLDGSLNVLVELTKNTDLKPGLTYANSFDSDVHCSRVEPKACIVMDNHTDYVQSLYFKLDGKTKLVTAKKMRHYTWYTVNVWACREQAVNETKEGYDESACSEKASYTFLTLEKPDADVVTNVRAVRGTSNKTNDVIVTWDPPSNPNGFVVAYSVLYTQIQEGTNDAALSKCVKTEDYEANRGFVLRGLNSGNYSIRVTPITVRGPGNASADFYIDIPAFNTLASYEWIWAVVCACLIILLVIAGIIWYVKRGLLSPTEAHKLFASVNPEYVSTVYVPDEWEVPRASIELVRELGQGSFGMVYEGLAKGIEKGKTETRCAVKTVNEHATDRERIEFLNEASVMKAFDTFHVVRLLGVVSRGQPTLVVMELMQRGDLKTYLRSHRPDSEAGAGGVLPKPPTLQNILQMAIEIADGMAYLSAKKFVHRDLAARNCMVAGDLTVKVGDFGMTRDIYETDYYRKGTKGLLPVRWMSPESLKDGVFSSNSDVWSYGVVLWEMATLAMQPYQGLSNEQVLRYVVEGGVMERPEHCPDRLYELMRACWTHRPHQRPSFLHLVADLAPTAAPHFRHRSFFHSPQGQEMYALQRSNAEEECPEGVAVGAVGTGSGSNLFGVSGRLASWVRELSSLRSRPSEEAAEPLQPLPKGPNGALQPP